MAINPLVAAAAADPARLVWLQAWLVNLVLISLAQRLPLLTRSGWVHAGALGTVLWGCLGPRAWLAVVLYLALGSAVTRVGFRRKQALGLAEGRGGRRGPENVWGSAACGALLALATPLVSTAWRPLLLVGFAASFAAKLADTFGSEVGQRFGRHCVLITSLRPVAAGTNGAISLEGTAASLLGSGLMAWLMALLGLLPGAGLVALVTLVGLVATLLESWLGASLQGRIAWLSNELVNAIQTAWAAALAIGLALLLDWPAAR